MGAKIRDMAISHRRIIASNGKVFNTNRPEEKERKRIQISRQTN